MPTQLAHARTHLTDAHLIAFFRAIGKDEQPMAASIMIKHLDEGATLQDIFTLYHTDRPEGVLEIELGVVKLDEHHYRITFGFHGGHVGDGGVWNVTYDAKGRVTACEQDGFWIH